MRCNKTIILANILLSILPIVGCHNNFSTLERRFFIGKKSMACNTIREAREFLPKLADFVLMAGKHQAPLQEMIDVQRKALNFINNLDLIPMAVRIELGESYGYLIRNNISIENNKLAGFINVEFARLRLNIIKKAEKVEQGLISALENLDKAVSRYPSPKLIELHDQVSKKLDEIKLVASKETDIAIHLAEVESESMSNLILDLRDLAEKKQFDEAGETILAIEKIAQRTSQSIRNTYNSILKMKGNTSNIIHRLSQAEGRFGKVIEYFNDVVDYCRKAEEDWIKTVNSTDRIDKATHLLADAIKFNQKAKEQIKAYNKDEALIYYIFSRRISARSAHYLHNLVLTSENREMDILLNNIQRLLDESNKFEVEYQAEADRIKPSHAKDYGIKEIEENIKDTENLLRTVNRVFRYYISDRTSSFKFPNTTVY